MFRQEPALVFVCIVCSCLLQEGHQADPDLRGYRWSELRGPYWFPGERLGNWPFVVSVMLSEAMASRPEILRHFTLDQGQVLEAVALQVSQAGASCSSLHVPSACLSSCVQDACTYVHVSQEVGK